MSEFDEMDFDEDELDALRNPEDLNVEDVFSMVMINKIKMTKVTVSLETEDHEEVDLPEVISELLGYMKDKMDPDNEDNAESNQFADQIMPLISQSLVSCLGRTIGIPSTGFMLADDMTRTALIWSMCMSFLLLKYVQKHKLRIFTSEEPVTEEELEAIDRKTQANKVAMMGAMVGKNPISVLRMMMEQGKLTDEDLKDMIGESDGELLPDDGDEGDDL